MFIQEVRAAYYRIGDNGPLKKIPDTKYVEWSPRRRITQPEFFDAFDAAFPLTGLPVPTEAYARGVLYTLDVEIIIELIDLVDQNNTIEFPNDAQDFPQLLFDAVSGDHLVERWLISPVVFCTTPGGGAEFGSIAEGDGRSGPPLQRIPFTIFMKSDAMFRAHIRKV